MSNFRRNRIKDGREKLHKQTNRQTNRHCENNGHLAVNQLFKKDLISIGNIRILFMISERKFKELEVVVKFYE